MNKRHPEGSNILKFILLTPLIVVGIRHVQVVGVLLDGDLAPADGLGVGRVLDSL